MKNKFIYMNIYYIIITTYNNMAGSHRDDVE